MKYLAAKPEPAPPPGLAAAFKMIALHHSTNSAAMSHARQTYPHARRIVDKLHSFDEVTSTQVGRELERAAKTMYDPDELGPGIMAFTGLHVGFAVCWRAG